MLPAALTLLLLSAALLTRGLIGHRIGHEPRCRKCNYNLTGVEAGKCPECGRPWTIETAARGRRVNLNRPIVCGLALLLLSAAGFTWTALPAIRSFNYYPYFPFDWLLAAAEKDNPNAVAELDRRIKDSKRSSNDLRRFAVAAIRYQTRVPSGLFLRDWMTALHTPAVMNAMGPDERNAYLDELQTFELRLPNRRKPGEPLPIDITFRAPVALTRDEWSPWRDRNWYYAMESADFTVRGTTDGYSSLADSTSESIALSARASHITTSMDTIFGSRMKTTELVPGEHEAQVTLRYYVFRSDHEYGPTAFDPWRREVTIKQKLQIDPADGPPSYTPVSGPEVVGELRSRIRFDKGPRNATASAPSIRWRLFAMIPLPCAVAGDLCLVHRETRQTFSEFSFPRVGPADIRGERDAYVGEQVADFIDKTDQFTVFLRCRPERALENPDTDEVLTTDLTLGTYVRAPDTPSGWRCIDCPAPPPPPSRPTTITVSTRPSMPQPAYVGARDYSALGRGLDKLWSTPTTQPNPSTTSPAQ